MMKTVRLEPGAIAVREVDRSSPLPESTVLARRLSALLGACQDGARQITACRVHQVIAGRRGTVFGLADAEVTDVGTGSVMVKPLVLKRFADDGRATAEARKVFRRLRQRARTHGFRTVLRPWAALLQDERILALPYPVDYRLPALMDASDEVAVKNRLSALLGALDGVTLTPVRYVPEKRCQIRYDLVTTGSRRLTVFGKVSATKPHGRQTTWMQTLHEALGQTGFAGSPAPVGYVPDWQMLLQRSAPGRTLYELQRTTGAAALAYGRTGAALAVLHSTPLVALPVRGADDELGDLRAMLDKGWLPPRQREAAARVVDVLARTSHPIASAATATCHRDFYDKQVLADGDRVSIIDLDTLASAPAAIDVGNFLAHLRLRVHQGYLDRAAARHFADRFLGGYRRCGGIDAGAVAWAEVATLVRLAVVYAVRPAWTHLVAGLLAEGAGLTGAVDRRASASPPSLEAR